MCLYRACLHTCIIYIIMQSCHIFIHKPSVAFSFLLIPYLTLQMLHYYPCLSDFSFSVSLFLPQRVKEERRGEDSPSFPPDASTIINSATVAPLCRFCRKTQQSIVSCSERGCCEEGHQQVFIKNQSLTHYSQDLKKINLKDQRSIKD